MNRRLSLPSATLSLALVLAAGAVAGIGAGAVSAAAAPAAASTGADQSLLNRYWVLDTVLGDRVIYEVPPGIHVHLRFQPTEAGLVDVTGILICNQLTGTATVRGDSITIAGIGTTKRGCQPDDPRVHTGVLTALTGTSSFWIDDNRLTIAKPTGPGLILHAVLSPQDGTRSAGTGGAG